MQGEAQLEHWLCLPPFPCMAAFWPCYKSRALHTPRGKCGCAHDAVDISNTESMAALLNTCIFMQCFHKSFQFEVKVVGLQNGFEKRATNCFQKVFYQQKLLPCKMLSF